MSASLLQIRNRESLLHTARNVRMSTFYTPSSFYLQLLEEDEVYDKLKKEMLAYFNGANVRSYCCATTGQTLDNSALKKLKIENLIVSICKFYCLLKIKSFLKKGIFF